MPIVKAASPADYGKAAALLETIRQERPEHWPFGLSPEMFDPGDLFLIRKSASDDPVGFVGWQERQLGNQLVGMYSIGVLPAYRHRGIAKEAVSRILCERAAGVDRVEALVAPGNLPSEKLAASLGIPLSKRAAGGGLVRKVIPWIFQKGLGGAGRGALKPWVAPTAGYTAAGAGGAAFWDQSSNSNTPLSETLQPWKWDKQRQLQGGLNALLSAGGFGLIRHGLKGGNPLSVPSGAGLFALAPGKDRLMQLGPAMDSVTSSIKQIADRAAPAASSVAEKVQTEAKGAVPPPPAGSTDWKTLAAGALVASALGGGAYALQKAMKTPPPAMGKMRVTLPTKNPDDSETSIEMPFDQSQALSNNLKSRLELDTRRRLYAETQERIRRRKGHPAPAFPNLESRLPQLAAAS